MVIFLVLLAALCLYQISFYGISKRKATESNGFFNDYMSIEKTNSIKGVFIAIVLMSHCLPFITLSDGIADKAYDYIIMYFINQSMVSMFMFLSGFGVMLSIDRKGAAYVKGIPRYRFLKVLLHFDIAVLIFGIVQACLGRYFSVKNVLLSLTGWDSLGNSNWYIFVILCLYLITFVAFTIAKKNKTLGFAITLALCITLIIVLHFVKQLFWYDTIMCYPLGMLFYLTKDKIETLLFKNKANYYLATGVAILLFGASLIVRNTAPGAIIKSLLFAVVIVLLTMKISINNRILQFLGKHLFSIYILQRIPMLIMDKFGISNNRFLFTILAFAITIPLATGFDFLLGKLDNLLFKKEA